MTLCDSAEWLAHPGTVGKAGATASFTFSTTKCGRFRLGQTGKLWFKTASPFEYFNDPAKTAEANSPDGTMSTLGDVGYLDAAGYLYLTDRQSHMIISGGVNIYPQEVEEPAAVTPPKVFDAAVFGVPNEDFGEEVKAVVHPTEAAGAGPDLEAELIAFCRARIKPISNVRARSISSRELPRLPTGKLYKAALRDRYWQGPQKPDPVNSDFCCAKLSSLFAKSSTDDRRVVTAKIREMVLTDGH